MDYYSAIKKKEILPFATTWMDLENIMLSEIRQRQIPYDITYMWNLKKNKENKNEHINTENRLVVSTGREWKMGKLVNGVEGKQEPSTISEKKNSLEGLNSRSELVETESANLKVS